MRWIRNSLVVIFLCVILATALTWRSGDPRLYPARPGEPSVGIEVVSNGFHSGVALPQPALSAAAARLNLPALESVSDRFAGFPVLEVGWGEARFYRNTPTLDSLDLGMALRALFRPGNESVVHVAGLPDRASRVLSATIVAITLSQEGFDALARQLDAALRRGETGKPVLLGPGLQRDSLFYAGTETFSIFRVCNHWTSALVGAAGVPTNQAWATLPDGLIFDLHWHAGLPVLRPASR
jgi:uncharacterized protein (TIGR02117 family)